MQSTKENIVVACLAVGQGLCCEGAGAERCADSIWGQICLPYTLKCENEQRKVCLKRENGWESLGEGYLFSCLFPLICFSRYSKYGFVEI